MRRISGVFPYNNTVQNRISKCTPQNQVRIPAGPVLFDLWGLLRSIFFLCDSLIKHSLCFPLSFNARFCINHNVLLVVRVVGLLFALEIAILGSFWLWTGLALQSLIFGTTKLDIGVQLFKSYKMSPLWSNSEGYRFHRIYGRRFYTVYTYVHTVYTVFQKVIYDSGQPYIF